MEKRIRVAVLKERYIEINKELEKCKVCFDMELQLVRGKIYEIDLTLKDSKVNINNFLNGQG